MDMKLSFCIDSFITVFSSIQVYGVSQKVQWAQGNYMVESKSYVSLPVIMTGFTMYCL